MHLNTSVVVALLTLKGVDTQTAAKLIHIPHQTLCDWLSGAIGDDESLVPFDAQLELLSLLGVRDSSPRNDVVHYWKLHESLFSKADTVYAPLQVILQAFGNAQVAYVAQGSDPMFMTSAKSHFALKFGDFLAMLEVTAHPLRKISFDPGTMPLLSWATGTQGVLLSEAEFQQLEPGSLRVKGLTQCLTYSSEVSQWEKLRETAIESGISAEQVASLLLGNSAPALTNTGLKASKPAATTKITENKAVSKPIPVVTQEAPVPAKPLNEADLFSKPVTGA